MKAEVVNTDPQSNTLSSDELSKLTEFFALLIKIDKKSKKKGKYESNNKRSTNNTCKSK